MSCKQPLFQVSFHGFHKVSIIKSIYKIVFLKHLEIDICYCILFAEPPSCEYTNLPGKFLPYTDRYVPQTFDVADCRRLCDQEREFQCRSFNYNTVRRDCFLSSDDTFAADRTALLIDRDFFYSERGSCSNGRYSFTRCY